MTNKLLLMKHGLAVSVSQLTVTRQGDVNSVTHTLSSVDNKSEGFLFPQPLFLLG